MKVIRSAIPDVLILEPKVFGDERGFFFESYNEKVLAEVAGITAHFVQDNHSRSAKNVLRGLHYQIKQPQGKLVRVIAGEVFDVAVDIRKNSPTFGKWAGFNLSAENKRMAWIPPGFRAWLSGAVRLCRISLQDDRLLGAGIRALHPLERHRSGSGLAASGRAGAVRQGSGGRRIPLSRGV